MEAVPRAVFCMELNSPLAGRLRSASARIVSKAPLAHAAKMGVPVVMDNFP